MTRKHFEAVAQNIAFQVARINGRLTVRVISPEEAENQMAVLHGLVADLCATFRGINPNFNSAKFEHAVFV